MVQTEYRIGAPIDNEAVNALHAAAFDHAVMPFDWVQQLDRHSLGWVTAHDGDALIGFVNVAWDGGLHAFVLDTSVAPTRQREGVGAELVRRAIDVARDAGCEWVHVDFEADLSPFYLDACGFGLADGAGLIRLR